MDADRIALWRTDPIAWAESPWGFYIRETRAPIRLFPHQREVLRLAFERDKDGRLLYDTIVYSGPKKSGKTTIEGLVAQWWALTQGEFNEVYLCANDFEQVTSRAYRFVRRSFELNPAYRGSVQITGRETTILATGTTITALPADPAGSSGGDPGFTGWDELWGYVSERSRRLWDELTPSPTRRDSIRFITTTAGFSGESILLQELYDRGLAGERVHPDLPCYRNGRLFVYWDHEPRMPWQTPAYYEAQRASLRSNAFLRIHHNQWVTTESSFVEMAWWDDCADPQARPVVADPTLPVWGGVDASTKRDSTAVVACTWDAAAKKVRLVWHRVFQPSPTRPLDFEATIEQALLTLRDRFAVQQVFYDPYQMVSVAQRLQAAGLPMREFPQSVPNLTEASTNLYDLIKGRNLVVYADAGLRLAVSRAVALETARGWRIAKEKAVHKIDVVVALAQASLGAVRDGNDTRPQHGEVHVEILGPGYDPPLRDRIRGRPKVYPAERAGDVV